MENVQDSVPEEFPSVPEESPSVRATLLDLAAGKRIGYSEKYIKKATVKRLERVYEEFKRQELDETNEQVVDMIIGKFAELMTGLGYVDADGGMEGELSGNGLLKSDLKSVVGYVTPYIPFVGILSGGLTVGKHVINNRCSGGSCVERPSSPAC